MSNNKLITTYEKISELMYQVECLIDVVSKACYYEDLHTQADTLSLALKLQYEAMDLISDIDPKIDVFSQI